MLRSRFGARVDGALSWLLFKTPLRCTCGGRDYVVQWEIHLYSISPTGPASAATTAFLQSVAEHLERQPVPAWRAWLAARDERRFGREVDAVAAANAGGEPAPGPAGLPAWLRGEGAARAEAPRMAGPLGTAVFAAVVVGFLAIFVCVFAMSFAPLVKWTAAAVACEPGDSVLVHYDRTDRLGRPGAAQRHSIRTVVRCAAPGRPVSGDKYWHVVAVVYAVSCVAVATALWLALRRIVREGPVANSALPRRPRSR